MWKNTKPAQLAMREAENGKDIAKMILEKQALKLNYRR